MTGVKRPLSSDENVQQLICCRRSLFRAFAHSLPDSIEMTICKKQKYGKRSALVFPQSVSRSASGENGQNDGGLWAAGHRKFLHASGGVGKGKIIPAQVLSVLQGKGPCGKEAFLLT